MHILQNRYELGNLINSKYSKTTSTEVSNYEGYDSLHHQDVLIKKLILPKKSNARELAIRLWEREIRIARKLRGPSGGKMFLELIDAFLDDDSDSLYIISRNYGKTLEEWVLSGDLPWFFTNDQLEGRKEVWSLFFALLDGVDALHNMKLLHRNINPGSVYYSEESDEKKFVLGGITWSLYLYNLNFLPNDFRVLQKEVSLFTPLEKIFEESASLIPNIFGGDIFSLGMFLCFIFNMDFPENEPSTEKEWSVLYNENLHFIEESKTLTSDESNLILKCISMESNKQYRTISELKQDVMYIIERFSSKNIIIEEKPLVYWYNKRDSIFLERLSKKGYNFDEVYLNPDKWLSDDFKNSHIYSTGLERHPLVLINKNDLIFGLKPNLDNHTDKLHREVLTLFFMNTREQNVVLKRIKGKSPIAILKEGLEYIQFKFERDPRSPWNRLWDSAQREITRRVAGKNEKETFIDCLDLMNKAEINLAGKDILDYHKVVKVQRDPGNEREKVIISLLPREDYRGYGRDLFNLSKDALINMDLKSDQKEKQKKEGKKRKEVLDKIIKYKIENGGEIELSESNIASSGWDHSSTWFIKRIDDKKMNCTLERQIKNKNKAPHVSGKIRPFEMNISLKLYERKAMAIEYLRNNNLLISSLLNPRYNTFYLGLDHDTDNLMLKNILNTIPMFLVQGPPGTGKTWVASEIVSMILKKDPRSRILISCKDHHPLNHLLEDVIEKIPDNITPPIIIRAMSAEREKGYESSDKILEFRDNNQTKKILGECLELNKINKILPENIRKEFMEEIKKNSSNPSIRWTDEISKVANVVFSTSTSSKLEWLGREASPYDWVILEEAAKSYPAELLIPMNMGQRWLLIGDQKQLPPYKYKDMANEIADILDEEQKKEERNLDDAADFRTYCLDNIKLFENLYDDFAGVKVNFSEVDYHPCIQLNEQRRLPPLISDMISSIFYETEFIKVKESPDKGDPFTFPQFLEKNELIWIDTPYASRNFLEKKDSSRSKYNEGEIQIIIKLLRKIKINKFFIKKKTDLDIVFLTPYNAQTERLSKLLSSSSIGDFDPRYLSTRCHNIDAYQGKQADVIVISLVRNNKESNIRSALGFLVEEPRLNVLFSRVKKRMIIIGCSKQFTRLKANRDCRAINEVFEFIKQKGRYIKAGELEGLL